MITPTSLTHIAHVIFPHMKTLITYMDIAHVILILMITQASSSSRHSRLTQAKLAVKQAALFGFVENLMVNIHTYVHIADVYYSVFVVRCFVTITAIHQSFISQIFLSMCIYIFILSTNSHLPVSPILSHNQLELFLEWILKRKNKRNLKV